MIIAHALLLIAQQPGSETAQRPAALGAVLDCRDIGDRDQRLSCFDSAVARLAQAEASRELVVVDRQALRQVRRRQFGFEGVRLPFFDGDDSQDGVPDEIRSTIARVRDLGFGHWSVDLAEGGTWRTTEASRHDPRVGQTARIRRAALGSFMMSISDRRAVRAVRVQ